MIARTLLTSILLAALPCHALTADQAEREAKILVRAVKALHPALDKYQDQDAVQANIARFEQRAGAARDAAQMYLAATELAASIRCGHTWTNVLNQQGAIRQRLLESADKLPLTMTLVEGRWLVLASAVPGIAAGDEVTAIDGFTTTQVIAKMMPYLRADGSSDGKRLRQLGHDRPDYSMMDIVWPLLSPPAADGYRLTVRRQERSAAALTVPAMSLAQREAALQPARAISEAWNLRIEKRYAVLTLPTFSLRRSKLDWKQFLQGAFAQLAQQRVPHLVIDIRDNEGGDGAIGLELMSYLVNTPATFVSDQSVTTYERVPYNLVRYLDTWDYSFFDRTGMVEHITEGPQAGRYRFRPNAGKTHQIVPKPDRFQGKAWLLVGAENSSATFMLAKVAKETGAATLVGQPTGGNLRGLNGGQLTWVNLPHSGVGLDIPLLASSYSATTPDASVMPDIAVRRSFAAQRRGEDQELAAALAAMR